MADVEPILIQELEEASTAALTDYLVIGGEDAKKINLENLMKFIKEQLNGGGTVPEGVAIPSAVVLLDQNGTDSTDDARVVTESNGVIAVNGTFDCIFAVMIGLSGSYNVAVKNYGGSSITIGNRISASLHSWASQAMVGTGSVVVESGAIAKFTTETTDAYTYPFQRMTPGTYNYKSVYYTNDLTDEELDTLFEKI